MPITALPTPPSRNDPANFAQRGDAFMAALPAFVTEANALQQDVNSKQATAAESAQTAATKAGEASVSANTATTKAGEASQSAQIASTKAADAATFAGLADESRLLAAGYAQQAANTLASKADLSGANFTGAISTQGSVGVGGAALADCSVSVTKPLAGAATSYGVIQIGVVQADVTGAALGVANNLYTAAANYVLPSYYHFRAYQSVIGAGSSITAQYGFFVDPTLTGAANNYGFHGGIPAGAGRWNLYMGGTAANYLAGNLILGAAIQGGAGAGTFRNNLAVTGAAASAANVFTPQIKADVTTIASIVQSQPATEAAAFTLSTLRHFYALNASLGAGSAISTQTGFQVSDLTAGATNYGFRGDVSAGANKWNLHMAGSADNYMSGPLGIGAFIPANTKVLIDRLNGSPLPALEAGTVMTLAGSSSASSPAYLQLISGNAGVTAIYFGDTDNVKPGRVHYDHSIDSLSLHTNSAQRLVVDNAGNLLVGIASGTSHTIRKNTTEGSRVLNVHGEGGGGVYFNRGDGTGANAAASVIAVDKNTTTSRSINAAGTINASGADYAEYMTKADGCGVIAKGDIVGVNAEGQLTDFYVEAVSFLIKSTDPSYVGGDTWGAAESIGLSRPIEPQFTAPEYEGVDHPGKEPVRPDAPADDASEQDLTAYEELMVEYEAAVNAYRREFSVFEQDQASYRASVEIARQHFDAITYPAYQDALLVFETALEAARQKVDRIAFAGQVPVNVYGAQPGDYIVPMPDGDGIAGIVVAEADLTFKQYVKAVGVVQNILPDGRANVRVKVA
jgi:hypothetical protein